MGGTSLQNLKENSSLRRNAFVNTIFFVLGFSVVFIALGVLFSTTFALLGGVTQIINIVAGAIVIVLGFNFIFDFWKILNIEKRFHLSKKPTTKPASIFFGMAFGAGWSPCIGPILSSILFLAGSSGNMGKGLLLLVVYSLGLGLPFLLTGLFLPAALRQLNRLKKHLGAIKIASGIFLILIGALILLGRLQKFNTVLFSFAYRLEEWEQSAPLATQLVFGGLFLLFALLVAIAYVRRVRRDLTDQQSQENAAVSAGEIQRVKIFRPLRALFLVVFISVSALSATGVLNFTRLLSSWFSFQGI